MRTSVSRKAVAISIFAATVVSLLVTALLVAFASMPDFYQRKLLISQDALAVHGAAFEEKLDQLQKDANEVDNTWSVQLSDEQINGWLADALPRKYPEKMPTNMHEPRIAIEGNQCNVACQYRNGATRVVLTLSLDLKPSNKPNELKLKVLSAKIGSVPGLEHQAVWPIAQAAYRSKARLRWLRRDVQPEAIVRIPQHWLDQNRQVHIENIEFKDGHLFVSGTSSERPIPAKFRRKVARK